MNSRSSNNIFIAIGLILLCGLIGGGIGEVLGQNFKKLGFLKQSAVIGMTNPLTLDFKLISITFGIKFNVNLLSLIGMLIGLFIYIKKCR